MMKYLLISTLLIIGACASIRSTDRNGNPRYLVYKIDSLNSYYFIYAKGPGDTLHKIVSRKDTFKKGKRITIGRRYTFKLSSLLKPFKIGDVTVIQNNLHVTGYAFDDSTTVRVERPEINNLYHGENVKGLYFIDK